MSAACPIAFLAILPIHSHPIPSHLTFFDREVQTFRLIFILQFRVVVCMICVVTDHSKPQKPPLSSLLAAHPMFSSLYERPSHSLAVSSRSSRRDLDISSSRGCRAALRPVIPSLSETLNDDFGHLIVARVIWLQAVRQHEVVKVVPTPVPNDPVVRPVVLNRACSPVEVVVGS